MLCFYHGQDNDGRLAAFWIRKLCEAEGTYFEPSDFVPMDYGTAFPLDSVSRGESVYIVDFSVEPDVMEALLRNDVRVVWIDHHASAIRKLEGYEDVPGFRIEGVAACELAYCWVKGARSEMDVGETLLPESSVPYFTRLVGDFDIWNFEYGDDTRDFQYGTVMEDTGPLGGLWDDLLAEEEAHLPSRTLAEVLRKGADAREYRMAWADEYLGKFAFTSVLEGIPCYCVNLGPPTADLFDDAKREGGICASFAWDGGKRSVSLYGDGSVDVSRIAEKFGGGGHPGAAGFSCDELPFAKGEAPA